MWGLVKKFLPKVIILLVLIYLIKLVLFGLLASSLAFFLEFSLIFKVIFIGIAGLIIYFGIIPVFLKIWRLL